MSRWFRHYAGMMRDDKLVRVAIRSKQTIERVAWVWGAILESAAEIDDGGRYDMAPDEAAYFLRADEADVRAILAALEAAGRLDSDRVVNWGDRQFASDKSKDRQAAYRKRQKEAGRSERGDSDGPEGNGDGHVTSPSRHGDAPETETELETEVSEPKGSSPRPWARLPEVSRQVWDDLLGNRKRKRLGNSATAWARFLADLGRVSAQTGIPPPDLIEQCTAKGWGAIYDPREQQNDQRSISRNRPNLTDLHRAATAASRDLEDRGGTGPSLSALSHG